MSELSPQSFSFNSPLGMCPECNGLGTKFEFDPDRFVDPDRTLHHIVDARRGGSPQGSQSVSVVAPTAMVADALATSVFLMDPYRGAAFIDAIPSCACLIVDRAGRRVRSARWRSASEPLPTKADTL